MIPQSMYSWVMRIYLLFEYVTGNTYAAAKMFEEADRIRLQQERLGLKKQVGETWCERAGERFSFRAHDQLMHVLEFKERVQEKVVFLLAK